MTKNLKAPQVHFAKCHIGNSPRIFRPYNSSMLHKKLFTLACVIAVVGVGACFLPPEHVPPPPLPPYLAQVRVFAIQVEDASGKDLVDVDAMSQAVAANFNQLWEDYKVRAKALRSSGNKDAILRITINHKSASSPSTSDGKQRWELELNTSSILATPDGRVLWQEQNETSQSMVWLTNGLPPDGWNSRIVRKQTAYSLAMQVGGKVLNSTPSK